MAEYDFPPAAPSDDAGAGIWVFGYGSLIWNPGFEYEESRIAQLVGWHRRFCLWSTHYRGTIDQPGLVLGLDRGGACRGIAFRIAPAAAAATLAYLDARELPDQTEHVYDRRVVRVTLECATRVPAVTYTARRSCSRYAGKLPPDRIARVLATSRGQTGSNRDYFLNTLTHLTRLGIPDPGLQTLADFLVSPANSGDCCPYAPENGSL